MAARSASAGGTATAFRERSQHAPRVTILDQGPMWPRLPPAYYRRQNARGSRMGRPFPTRQAGKKKVVAHSDHEDRRGDDARVSHRAPWNPCARFLGGGAREPGCRRKLVGGGG